MRFLGLLCGVLSLATVDVSSIHVSSRVNAVLDAASRADMSATIDIDADVDASTVALSSQQAQVHAAIASHLDDELFRHLSSLSSRAVTDLSSEAGVSAQFLEKRVGIEVEYQGAPRMIIAVEPAKLTEFKEQFTKAGGTMYAKHKDKWLMASTAPLIYGFEWLESAKDNGAPYWMMSVDNERVDLDSEAVDFWAPYLVTAKQDLADSKEELNGDCGRNAAVELVTYPLLTTGKTDATPNLVYINQMARILSVTLRKFMLLKSEGGVVDVTMLANHATFSDDFRSVLSNALKKGKHDDYGDPTTLVVVTVGVFMKQFELDVDAHFAKWTDIKKYKFEHRYLDYFLFNKAFILNGKQAVHYYERFFTFRLLDNKNLVDTPVKLSNKLGMGPQLNFGFPVANFGYAPATYMDKIQVLDKKDPKSDYVPFTAHIWTQVHKYGERLFLSAKTIYDKKYPKSALTAQEIADARGFACIALEIYFITVYLGLTEKFAQSVLLKSALNDLLRLLPRNAKRTFARWWDAHGSDAAFKQFDLAAKKIWVNAGLNKIKTKSYAPLRPANYNDIGHASRDAAASEFFKQVFWAVDTDDKSRWADEQDSDDTHVTIYGTLNVAVKKYPKGRNDMLPISKSVPPFTITDADGILRPAVLLEHRDADKISELWTDFTQAPLAKPEDMAAALKARIDEMTVIQAPNKSLLERISIVIRRTTHTIREWYDTNEQKNVVDDDGVVKKKKRNEVAGRPKVGAEHDRTVAEKPDETEDGDPFDDSPQAIASIVSVRNTKATQAMAAWCKYLTDLKKDKAADFAKLSADKQADLKDC